MDDDALRAVQNDLTRAILQKLSPRERQDIERLTVCAVLIGAELGLSDEALRELKLRAETHQASLAESEWIVLGLDHQPDERFASILSVAQRAAESLQPIGGSASHDVEGAVWEAWERVRRLVQPIEWSDDA